MTYVVAEPCVNCRYTDCALVCPVEAFHLDDDMLVINPETCIDCDACVPECPVEAVFSEANVPAEWKRQTAEALFTVLRGQQPKQLPPLDLSRGTDFQQKVWKALLTIIAGETRSYGEVARMIGLPGAARAVGAACGTNAIPVLIPCHRVLAANRRIGGFSAGLKWKRLLLERETMAASLFHA